MGPYLSKLRSCLCRLFVLGAVLKGYPHRNSLCRMNRSSKSSSSRGKLATATPRRRPAAADADAVLLIDDPERLKGRYELGQSADFVFDLYGLLQDADNDRGLAAIVSWQRGGWSFRIHDREAFVRKLLVSCSALTQYKSFQRVIERVGFEYIRNGELKGGYRHPSFRRGEPRKLKEMKSIGLRSAAWYDLGNTADESVFPNELYRLLQEAREESYERFISWHEDGKAFHVHDPDVFELMLLQNYTNLGTFQAFRDCLDRYGFEEVFGGERGGGGIIFRHPSFVRGQPSSLKSARVEGTSSLLGQPAKMKGRYDLGHSDDFPFDIYGLLQDADTDPSMASIISWHSGGRALQIHDREQFVNKILRVCSTNTKYDSFVTTLRRFGFRRNTDRPKECNVFEHGFFLRNQPQKLMRMRSTEISYKRTLFAKYDFNNNDDDSVFCKELHRMLQDAHEETYERLISWHKDGKSFQVHDTEIFEYMVLRKYTNCESFQTFRHSLIDFGFNRIHNEDSGEGYHHASFARDHPRSLPSARIGYVSPIQQRTIRKQNDKLRLYQTESTGIAPTSLIHDPAPKRRKPLSSWTSPKYDLSTTLSFVNELHRLLEDADKDESLGPIISWHRDGKSFKVHDRLLFERMILHNYSNVESYDSFAQELRFFNFQEIMQGEKSGGYCHPSFIRGSPEDVDRVLCGVRHYRVGRGPEFPHELYALLEDSESNGCMSLIKWLPDGKSFVVVDHIEFERRILLKFTALTKFSSFEKLLSFFRFKKCCRKEIRIYSHPHFLRGEPEKLRKVKPKYPFPRTLTVNERSEKRIQRTLNSMADQYCFMDHNETLDKDGRSGMDSGIDTVSGGSFQEEESTVDSASDSRTDDKSEQESLEGRPTKKAAPSYCPAACPPFRGKFDGTEKDVATVTPHRGRNGDILLPEAVGAGKNSAMTDPTETAAPNLFHHPLFSISETSVDQTANGIPVEVLGKLKMLLSLQAANVHVQALLRKQRKSELEKLRQESATAESLVDKAASDLGVTSSEFRSLLSDYQRDMGESRTRIFHEICMWNTGFPIPNRDEVTLLDQAIPGQLLEARVGPLHNLPTVRRCYQLETFVSLFTSLEGPDWMQSRANWTRKDLGDFVRRRVCEILSSPGRLEQELRQQAL